MTHTSRKPRSIQPGSIYDSMSDKRVNPLPEVRKVLRVVVPSREKEIDKKARRVIKEGALR